jgi:hypothetical protein
MQNDYKLKKIT